MSALDFDRVMEQYHRTLDELLKGNPEPVKQVYSHRDDATLANPFGPVARGWRQVAETIDLAASNFRDGGTLGFERVSKNVTPDLAYVVEVERLKARLGGKGDVTPFTLRVTSILRREDGVWKVVHRHADPITSPRPPESVLQK